VVVVGRADADVAVVVGKGILRQLGVEPDQRPAGRIGAPTSQQPGVDQWKGGDGFVAEFK